MYVYIHTYTHMLFSPEGVSLATPTYFQFCSWRIFLAAFGDHVGQGIEAKVQLLKTEQYPECVRWKEGVWIKVE